MRTLQRATIGFLTIILLVCSQVSAQTPGGEYDDIVKAQPLADLTSNMRYEAVSPDGSSIAWAYGSQLCFLNFSSDSAQQNCVDLPPHFKGFGQYSDLSWSPDGKTLAFTEDAFIFTLDSDIWTYDIASGTFQDRTDDTVFGSWKDDSISKSALIDYLPLWSSNDDLYFFRSTHQPSADATMALELLSLASSTPTPLADYSTDLPAMSVFKPPVISPDGTKMAMAVLAADNNDPRNGVYLVSLKDGSLKQMMTTDDFKLGLPDWAIQAGGFSPTTLQWAGNDGLIVSTQSQSKLLASLNQMTYYVDVASGKVTPLADFSAVPDATTFTAESYTAEIPIRLMPRQGAVMPNGKQYLYVTFGADHPYTALYVLNLPPDGLPPAEIGVIDRFQITPAANAPPAITPDNQHALLYGYWLTLKPLGT